MDFDTKEFLDKLSTEKKAELKLFLEQQLGISTPLSKDEETPIEEKIEEKEHIDDYLYRTSPIFRTYPDLSTYNQNKNTKMIVGQVQSGKTRVICGIAVRNVCYGVSTLIIVRNLTGDYFQLRKKFEDSGEFAKWGFPVIYCGDRDTQLLHMALTGERPAVVIALAHDKQLERVNGVIENACNPVNFDLIIDEADDLAYKKETGKPYIDQLNKLRPIVRQTFLVSATVFTMLFRDFELDGSGIYELEPPKDYKSVHDLKFNSVDFDLRDLNTDEGIAFYSNLADEDVFEDAIVQDQEDETYNHPIIVLHKTTRKRFQNNGVHTFATHPELRYEWCAMSYNGEGVSLYHRSLLNRRSIEIDGVPGIRGRNGVWFFKKSLIQSVLQYLKDLDPNANTFSHICIITGRLGDRGVNFTSSDYQWHLTHQIVHVPRSMSAAGLVQSMRILGVYKDDIPLNLYATSTDTDNLLKIIQIQKDFVNGCIDMAELKQSCPFLYKKVKIYSDMVPKGMKLCNKGSYELNLVVRSSIHNVRTYRRDDRREECVEQLNSNTGTGKIIRFFVENGTCSLQRFRDECIEISGIKFNSSLFRVGKYSRYGPVLIHVDDDTIDVHPDYKNLK